jgi:hypothetical protein
MSDSIADEIKQNLAYYESLSNVDKQKLKEEEEKSLVEFRKWVAGEPNEYNKPTTTKKTIVKKKRE